MPGKYSYFTRTESTLAEFVTNANVLPAILAMRWTAARFLTCETFAVSAPTGVCFACLADGSTQPVVDDWNDWVERGYLYFKLCLGLLLFFLVHWG